MKDYILRAGHSLSNSANKAAGLVVLLSSLSALGFPTQWMSYVVISLYVLQQGAVQALGVWVASVAPLVLLAVFMGSNTWVVALSVATALCVWLAAAVYRYTQSWAMVIEVTLMLSIVLILLAHLVYPDIHLWWIEQFDQLVAAVNSSATTQTRDLVTIMSRIATGIQALSAVVTAYICVILGYWWWRVLTQAAATLKQQCLNFRASSLSLGVLIVLGVLGSLGWWPAIDALPVAVLPFFLDGMGLVHGFVLGRPNAGLWLGLFYIALFFVPYFVLLVLALGVVDCGVDLRRRIRFG